MVADATLTRHECGKLGGTIVGDPGDGSTQRATYLCDSNGAPPLAIAVPSPGEPIAMEGEVCCGPTVILNDDAWEAMWEDAH